MNRATADNQSAQSEEEGLEPTKEWVKDLVDEIIAEEFASPDLELHWLDEDADPADLETELEGRVKLGAVTLNEMRDALGLDPYDNAAADRPMVLTPTGYVPIRGGEPEASVRAVRTPKSSQSGSPKTSIPTSHACLPANPALESGRKMDKSAQLDLAELSAERANVIQDNAQPHAAPATDSRVISDAAPGATWLPGVRYAGGLEEGEGENRIPGEPGEGTPAQQARWTIADARLRDLLSQVQAVDPSWKPTPGFRGIIEGEIADLEAQAQQTQTRLAEVTSVGSEPPPEGGHHYVPRSLFSKEPLSPETRDVFDGASSGPLDDGTVN